MFINVYKYGIITLSENYNTIFVSLLSISKASVQKSMFSLGAFLFYIIINILIKIDIKLSTYG